MTLRECRKCFAMNDLTVQERDLLARVMEKPELQPFFFRKVKDLKWFGPLDKHGFFQAENIPSPVPAKEEGYVQIPFWPALEYLVAASEALSDGAHDQYAERFLQILRQTTEYAKTKC